MTAFNITTLPTGTITLTLDFAVRERQANSQSPYDWVATFRDSSFAEIESDRYFGTVQETLKDARKRFGIEDEGTD